MEAKAVDADAIFRAFTACGKDPKTLLLDVRPHKDYKKGHINQAFNPRLATNGTFLADYSQAQYSMPWSQDCWCVCVQQHGNFSTGEQLPGLPACVTAHSNLHHSFCRPC